MMSRMAINQMLHNFHKPYRIKEVRKRDEKTHAEVAGISSGKLAELLSGWGSRQPFLSKLRLSKVEKRLWFGDFKLPGTKITKYRLQHLNQ
jgi:hypothetical protein